MDIQIFKKQKKNHLHLGDKIMEILSKEMLAEFLNFVNVKKIFDLIFSVNILSQD